MHERTTGQGGRANGLGDVVAKAADADPQNITMYFAQKVVPLIDANKRELAVLAIRSLITSDEYISDDTAVELVSGTTKKTLQKQSRFVFAEFLAGVFLFTVAVDNRLGKIEADAVSEKYIDSFRGCS